MVAADGGILDAFSQHT